MVKRDISGNRVTVAVVGGAGFLGSHLVNHLIEDRNCNVLVIDNLVAGRREFIHPKAAFEYADITQSEAYLKYLFQHYSADYVMNYAAYPYIPVSFERPLHVFAVNANGALNVINAAQEANCKGILQVSSAEIYGEAGSYRVNPDNGGGSEERTRRISEEDCVIPHSSYGAAKAAIDAMVQVRWKEAKTPCIALRQFNCVGERETHPYVVPEIISQLSQNPTVEAEYKTRINKSSPYSYSKMTASTVSLGNNSFRDFLYAVDAVRMAAELLEKGNWGEVYNLGSQEGIKIYDLAKLIGKKMGFENVAIEQDPDRVRPWEIWHLCSDNSKIYSVIGYRPQYDLGKALERTIAYYNENGRKWIWEK